MRIGIDGIERFPNQRGKRLTGLDTADRCMASSRPRSWIIRCTSQADGSAASSYRSAATIAHAMARGSTPCDSHSLAAPTSRSSGASFRMGSRASLRHVSPRALFWNRRIRSSTCLSCSSREKPCFRIRASDVSESAARSSEAIRLSASAS